MCVKYFSQATANDAEVVIDGLGSRENSSTAFNAFEVIAELEDVWKDVIKRLKNHNETIRITTETFAGKTFLQQTRLSIIITVVSNKIDLN